MLSTSAKKYVFLLLSTGNASPAASATRRALKAEVTHRHGLGGGEEVTEALVVKAIGVHADGLLPALEGLGRAQGLGHETEIPRQRPGI